MDEISRMEKILRGDPIEPITRLEKFCAKAAGTYTGDPLSPVTRLEWFLDQISSGGGGGETKSTLIQAIPGYNALAHYTNTIYQQVTAPEGIVYDKVWSTDEFLGWRSEYNEVNFYNAHNTVYDYMFTKRTSLKSMCLGTNVNKIGANAFNGSSALVNLVLYKDDAAAQMVNISAFASTPFASGGTGGKIWVPSNLVSTYTSASNWSTIIGYANNSIAAIEGSEWEL